MITLQQFDNLSNRMWLLCAKADTQHTINDELEPILGKKFMGYASGNFSDFESQKQKDQQRQITMQ